MLPCNLLLKISVTLAVVYSLPVKTVKRSAELDKDEITDKLSRLKHLLVRLEDIRQAKAKVENQMKDGGSDSVELNIETLGKAIDSNDKSVHSDSDGAFDGIVNLKKLSGGQKLKLLKELVSEVKQIRHENLADEGTFADAPVPESKERADLAADWKDLTKRLEGEIDNGNLQQLRESEKPINIETETKEGTFGEFRGEIKYAVEKNLLSDIALAMHSGISVDELLEDLIAEGNARNPDVVWSKRDRD